MVATLALTAMLALTPAPVTLTPDVAKKLQEIAFQAAREGDVPTLREYLAAGQPLQAINPRGDTLLTVAAYARQEQAVRFLLRQPGVIVDARNRMGLTALAGAAFKGDVRICEALLQAGADVNAASRTGQTALMFAALSGKLEVVELLIRSGANVRAQDRAENTPLSLAQGQGATVVVERLQRELAKPITTR